MMKLLMAKFSLILIHNLKSIIKIPISKSLKMINRND